MNTINAFNLVYDSTLSINNFRSLRQHLLQRIKQACYKHDSIPVACATAEMPQHHHSFIAIAYKTNLSLERQNAILACLDDLQLPDFDEANQAYLSLRHYRQCGDVVSYAIADSLVAAIQQLQETSDSSTSWSWV